ncbi:transporter [Candidatus Latescibacterota bacterium]
MKKAMVLSLTILCTLVLISSTVFAWDDLLYSNFSPGTGTPGNGSVGPFVRYGLSSEMFDQNGDKQDLGDTGTELRIPIRARYTITNNLRAFAIVPIVSKNKYLTPDGEDNSGIGDIWLGAQYAVMPEGMLTFRGALDIPTGDDEKGLGNAGGFGIDVAAQTSKTIIEDKLGINGNVGIRYNAEDSDTKWQPGLAFYLTGRATYQVTENIPARVVLTYLNYGDGKADGTKMSDSTVNWLELEVITWQTITEGISPWISLNYSLMGTNTPADLGIRVGVSYLLFGE